MCLAGALSVPTQPGSARRQALQRVSVPDDRTQAQDFPNVITVACDFSTIAGDFSTISHCL